MPEILNLIRRDRVRRGRISVDRFDEPESLRRAGISERARERLRILRPADGRPPLDVISRQPNGRRPHSLSLSLTDHTRAPRARGLLAEVVDGVKRDGSNGADLRESFDAFWDAFPKKAGKGAAWKWWHKRKPIPELLATMIAALDWQRRQEHWLRDGGRYIPNPLTWLNAERWQDEPTRIPHMNATTIALLKAGEELLKS